MNFMHYYRPIVIRTTGKAACLKCTLHKKTNEIANAVIQFIGKKFVINGAIKY